MGTLGDLLVLGGGPSIVAVVIKVKIQTLIFGIIHVGNVKVIPTFRINFSNFPWQLLGACRPAGYTCLMQPAPACVGQF